MPAELLVVVDETNLSEEYFAAEGNNLKALCAMALGIKDDDGKDIGNVETDAFPKTDFHRRMNLQRR